MLTPHVISILARVAVGLLCAAIGVWAIDPFHITQHLAFAQDNTAYGAAFYMAVLLGGAAFPKLRRNDIALVGVALASFLECMRAIAGVDASLWDLAAATAGVLAAWAPASVEQLRRHARASPFLSFRQIRGFERRGRPGRADPTWTNAEIPNA
jgi:hypothetical protein